MFVHALDTKVMDGCAANSGRVPVKRLSQKPKAISFGNVAILGGIVPVIGLLYININQIFSKSPYDSGTVPVKEFSPTSRFVNFESLPIDSGRLPNSSFLSKERFISPDKPSISDGIVPAKLLSSNFKFVEMSKCESAVMVRIASIYNYCIKVLTHSEFHHTAVFVAENSPPIIIPFAN